MKAVSEAGTPLLTRYSMVAFKDRRTNKWKVLDTGTDHPFFIAAMEQYKQVERLSRSSSEEDRERAQQWARNPPESWRKLARGLGEQFRADGVVQGKRDESLTMPEGPYFACLQA